MEPDYAGVWLLSKEATRFPIVLARIAVFSRDAMPRVRGFPKRFHEPAVVGRPTRIPHFSRQRKNMNLDSPHSGTNAGSLNFKFA
jgi:hypothetical protein